MESLRSEVAKQGNELAAQMVTLDVQQSAIQKLLQDVAERRTLEELRARLESVHIEQESMKNDERRERAKLEEQQRAAATTLITAYKVGMEELRQELERKIEAKRGGNTAFEQGMEEKLGAATVEMQRLQKEFDQFKNNQLREHTGQQANSLLGQMVEKQGQIVVQQTGAKHHSPQSGTIPSTTFQFVYVSDDSDRLGHLLDLLRGSKGHTLVFVNGDQRVKFLQEFLHRAGFDAFSKYQPYPTKITIMTVLIMTTADGLRIADIMNKENHVDHNNWKNFLHDVTTILNYAPQQISRSIGGGSDMDRL